MQAFIVIGAIYAVILLLRRAVWAEFLTNDPSSWKVRVGEHNMFEEDLTQLDVNVDKIIFHPQRDR